MATSKDSSKQYCDLLTPVVCDECDGQNEVINYCLQCNANICNGCKNTHCNTRLYKDHIVLLRTHPEVVMARRSKKIYCPSHTGKEYVSYCTKCKVPCCVRCMIEKHDGHKFSDLEKTISQTEIEVDTLVNDMEANIIPLSVDVISKLEGHLSIYKRSLNDLKESAKKKKLHYIEEIDKRYGTFIAEVDMRSTKHLEIIERKKQEMMETLEEIQSATIKGKKTAVDASILQVKEELEEVLSTIPRHIACPGILSLCPSNYQLPTVYDMIGTISNASEKVLFTSTSCDQMKVLKTIDGVHASAIIATYRNEIWIYNKNVSEIEIYDENFSKKRNISYVYGDFYDMALYDESHIIATDLVEGVVKISDSGSIIILFDSMEWASGICMNKSKEVVVGEIGYFDDGCPECYKLVVYSLDGLSILQEMEEDQMLYGGDMKQLRQTVSGEYVVAIDNRIECLSTELKAKWTHTLKAGINDTVVGGLYCDKYNNILVGDRHMNEIVMLSIDGERVRTLLSAEDGICGPLSMDVDSKGRLWIGQDNNVLVATYST